MPHGIYYNFNCDKPTHPKFIPTSHQLETVEYFSKSKYKGLLLYHKLGAGKTCTSILIADKFLRKKRVKKVYVLSPGSLRKGWLTEYCDVCGIDPKYLNQYFGFITYNYDVSKRLPNFNDSLVIIDEVHNIINGVKNYSKTALSIYKALAKSNCRILALSGTPIFNNIYEWPILGNLLKPGAFPDIIGTKKLNPNAFLNLFRTREDGSLVPKIPVLFKRSLEGIVSYYPGAGSDLYPRVIHMPPLEQMMTPVQEQNYFVRYELEQKILGRYAGDEIKMMNPAYYDELQDLKTTAALRNLSRPASNFYYGKYLEYKDDLVSEGGWIDPHRFRKKRLVTKFSPKVAVLLVNIALHNKQKHMVFTSFKTKSGVYLLHSMLKMCGITSAIFSGDLDDVKRARLLRRFNAKKNRYGEKLRVLLVTEAGAEGISLLETSHMHILESNTREVKLQQAIGRVVRYKSHHLLPKEEQVVRIWRYWSTVSPVPITIEIKNKEGELEKKVITDKQSIDIILYEKGQRDLKKIDSFLKLLQNVSVTKI